MGLSSVCGLFALFPVKGTVNAIACKDILHNGMVPTFGEGLSISSMTEPLCTQ